MDAPAQMVAVPQLSPAARRRQLREKVVSGIIALAAFTGIAAIVLIIVFVGKEALGLLLHPEARHEAIRALYHHVQKMAK